MHATLSITGPLDLVTKAGTLIEREFGDLDVRVTSDDEVLGYTVDRAKALIVRLAFRQFRTLKLVVDHGGWVPDEMLREKLSNDDSGQLRGLTGPIAKHVKRMTQSGELPTGTGSPLSAQYDATNASYQRTQGLRMPDALVPVFSAAFAALGDPR